MIVLSKEQIEKMVDPDQMMDQIEEAYRIYGSGEFYMPPRPTVEHENKQLMYMPCYTKDIIGTKILSIFPENSKLGLPSIDGIVLLNDYTTGAPIAVMDGQSVTAWRTGAVGGVGIRHLSRKDCRTVGIIGAGMQGFHQAVYACAARDIHTVYVFNHSDRDLTDYLERLKKAIDKEDVKVVQCKAVEELVRNSDIICTTTPSTTPVLPDDKELLRGKCIIAIGSYMPEMREIPDAVLDLVDNVYIELPYACEESGDLSQPLASGKLTKDRIKLMHEYLVSGEKEIKEGQTTYFKSVGMGLFDLLSGWTAWAPFTFIIVGIMGYVVGAMTEKHDQYGWKVAAIFAAFVIKIVGYYIAEIILYGNFIAPISSVPGNVVQIAVAAVVVLIVIEPIEIAVKKIGITQFA